MGFYKNPDSLPYYADLVRLREVLASELTIIDVDLRRIFPFSCCNDSARAVYLKTGLEEIGGYFTFSHVPELNNQMDQKHAWNYDSERNLWVDLTMKQFGNYPEIAILKPDHRILRLDGELTEIQRGMNLPDATRTIKHL
ncbi:MAG: hypothetical protein KC506_02120 [Nanoarchaeota archaeon]|nr:hypothetical protein [Nanoarchaeota archaeon]